MTVLALSLPPFLRPLFGGAAGAAASGLLGVLAGAVSQAADWLVRGVGALISHTTRPDLGASWFRERYGVMVSLALFALVGVLAVGAMQAVVRRDPGMLVRVLLVQLPLATLLTGAAAGMVQWSLHLVDQLSDAVAANTGHGAGRLLADMSSRLALMSGGLTAPVFVTLVVSLLIVVGAFLLWIELVLRSAAVDATTLFLPLAIVTMTWPAASRIARRLAETLTALVLSKLVVVGVLSLGVAAVTSASVNGVITGTALLLMAALAPYSLFRLIPLAEFGAVTHLEGMARRATVRPAMTAWSARGLLTAGSGPGPVGVTDPGEAEDAAPGMYERGPDWHGTLLDGTSADGPGRGSDGDAGDGGDPDAGPGYVPPPAA